MQDSRNEAQILYTRIQALEQAIQAELRKEAKQLRIYPASNHLARNSGYMTLVDILINLELCNSPNISETEFQIRFAAYKPLALEVLEPKT